MTVSLSLRYAEWETMGPTGWLQPAFSIFGAIASRLFSWEICRRPAENWQHRWKSPGIWEYRFLWGSRMNCLYPVQR